MTYYGTPVPMDHHEKMKIRTAAFRVTRLYPGPVGEVLSRELLTWEEFGYRLGDSQLISRLVNVILTTQLPTDTYEDSLYPRPFNKPLGNL